MREFLYGVGRISAWVEQVYLPHLDQAGFNDRTARIMVGCALSRLVPLRVKHERDK